MELRHGGLALDIPQDWIDCSSLLFMSPDPDGGPPNAASPQTEAVSVRFVANPDGGPREWLDQQTATIQQVDDTFEVTDQGPYQCGFGKGWLCIQRLNVQGMPVRQLSAAIRVDELGILISAAAPDGTFDTARKRLTTILQSLRPAGS